MALNLETFQTIRPSQFISFTIPHPTSPDSLIRVAVLDSPVQCTDSPQVAAMFVPEARESDWIFSTESGHFQLLFSSPGVSRLVLIGNQFNEGDFPLPIYQRPLKCSSHHMGLYIWSKSLLPALSLKSLFKNGIPQIPILTYEDNVVSSVVIHKCTGCLVGEMLVEDVEIESENEVDDSWKPEFRRRLRFKRMPNLIQTEIRIVTDTDVSKNGGGIGEVAFVPDLRVLVHPYLAPMAASLSLISEYIEGRILHGFRPKALCLGVGGGALLSFLRNQLGFEVMGIDADQEVLKVAKHYFGLEDGEFIRVTVGDAIKSIKKLACQANCNSSANSELQGPFHFPDVNQKFDAVMVDLDSSDARTGISAPPLEFIRKHVLLAAKLVLSEFGILAINVILPSRSFYSKLVHRFQQVFEDVYRIDVNNGENFVLVATVSPKMVSLVGNCSNSFLTRLKLAIPEAYINSITKM